MTATIRLSGERNHFGHSGTILVDHSVCGLDNVTLGDGMAWLGFQAPDCEARRDSALAMLAKHGIDTQPALNVAMLRIIYTHDLQAALEALGVDESDARRAVEYASCYTG